jgi:hypothetical protein
MHHPYKGWQKDSSKWDAELLVGMTDGPMDFFGHRQVKPKQKIIHLSAPLAEARDEEAETVRDQVLSDGYSASEPSDVADAKGRQESMETQTWEDAGLEHGCDQGGAISPGMMAPLTPLAEMPSDDDVDIPAASHKHASSSPLASEGLKSQKMDDDPIPTPNVKAAKAEGNINQNAEVELCHNDEKKFDACLEDEFHLHDDEDVYIAGQTEGAGPPQVIAEKLKELDEQTALDELDKLYKMDVIQPVALSPEETGNSNAVDTTLVFYWRYPNDNWIRQ